MSSPLVRSYPEKFVRWIPLPYPLSFILLWEGIFLVDYFISERTPTAQEHLIEYGCLIFFFSLVCITIVYCSKVLIRLYNDVRLFIDDDENSLFKWYEQKLKPSYEGWLALAFALFFTVAVNVTVSETMNQFTPVGTGIYYFRVVYEYIGFFFLGLGIWALIYVIFIPIGLTKFKIRVSVNQISGRGLQALGASYLKMSLAITITFIPLVVAAILSPLMADLTILVWLGIGTAAIFGFFLLPQIGIHQIMVHEKQQRLLSFAGHLEEAMERSIKDPTAENMQRLKELFELQTHLKQMNEWPFNVNTLWQLVTALLIPVILAMIEIFFNK